MTIKTKIAITATAFCLAFTANAAVQRDPYDVAEGALLDNVARTIETGMKRVEKRHKNNNENSIVLIDGADGTNTTINPYVEGMKIDVATSGGSAPTVTSSVLAIKFHDALAVTSGALNSGTLGTNSEVPPTMSGIVIKMVPIYKKGNKKITGWECVTNADEVKNEVMGEEPPLSGRLSYISHITNYNFLGNCRFVPSLTY